MRFFIRIFFILLITSSCEESNKYLEGHFPDEVVNFEAVNTSYDDYNSDLPWTSKGYLFHFSSNRGPGGDFNIVGKDTYIDWDEKSKKLTVDINRARLPSPMINRILDSVNTFCNELGPYSFSYIDKREVSNPATYLFLYADDCGGDYDIRFTTINTFQSELQVASSPLGLAMINTNANELYPTFFGKDFRWESDYGTNPINIETLIYCSDKDGGFDIYQIPFLPGNDLVGSLRSPDVVSSAKLSISSNANDKCPFVNGKILVFTSDRQGGYGGFDLYYSIYQGNAWSEPINFGDKVNTESDEYRPVVLSFETGYDNNLLLFSSNRPGGKGGFDLYYVGVEKMIN